MTHSAEETDGSPDLALLQFTDAQYHALGKLTIRFSIADQIISRVYFLLLTASPTLEQKSLDDIQGMRFWTRAKALEKILESDGRKSALVARDHLTGIIVLAERRNNIVHGWLRWDFRMKQPMSINAQKTHGMAVADITDLNDKLFDWSNRFLDLTRAFLAEAFLHTPNGLEAAGEL